jgi:PAS domain S-box-containing protein
VTRNAVLNPRSASGEVIPTALNASALRDANGNVIGAIGVLRDMRELDKARAYAESLIKNAPDPVFVSDLEGKILEANDAVSELLGFRRDEVVEQSLSRFISEEETREFTAALREVVERGVTRNARLNPRAATGESSPTSLNASALRDSDGNVIGAIGVLRDMRELDKARAYAESLIKNAPDPCSSPTSKERSSKPTTPSPSSSASAGRSRRAIASPASSASRRRASSPACAPLRSSSAASPATHASTRAPQPAR